MTRLKVILLAIGSAVLTAIFRIVPIDFTIRDGGNEYHYTAEVYEDNAGYSWIKITEK